MSTPALNPLVDKIRTAHPGAYDDMDDATLTKAVLAKYPQYSDLAAPKIQKPQAPEMQPSFLAHALGSGNTEQSAIANPQQPAEQFALEHPEQQGKLALASGIGAAGSLPQTLPFLGAAAKALWPTVKAGAKVGAGYAATEGVIQGAKKIPGVGDVVSKIPGIDYLPFLISSMGGHQEKEPPLQEGAPLPANPYEQAEALADKRKFIANQRMKANQQSQMETGIYPGAPLPEAPATVPPRTKIGNRVVLTPEEAQQSEQVQRIAKRRASERGMQYAAGMKPAPGKVPAP